MSTDDDLAAIARRHGFSPGAAEAAADALRSGRGRMAQFSHPDLGGMGQWSPGMTMIGAMSDRGLRDRVAAFFDELSGAIGDERVDATAGGAPSRPAGASPDGWWPADLGRPSSTGAQNDMRYALFPDRRRLAVSEEGQVSVYDTGDHRITGFGQQNGGTRTLSLSGRDGSIALDELQLVSEREVGPRADAPTAADAPTVAATGGPDALDNLERLADLHRKGVLSDSEFSAKKADLLSRI